MSGSSPFPPHHWQRAPIFSLRNTTSPSLPLSVTELLQATMLPNCKTLKGSDRKKGALLTATLYPTTVFGMGFFLNFFIWGEHSVETSNLNYTHKLEALLLFCSVHAKSFCQLSFHCLSSTSLFMFPHRTIIGGGGHSPSPVTMSWATPLSTTTPR